MNNFTLQSITPDPVNFESTYSTYEGDMNMLTIHLSESEKFDHALAFKNLAARSAIQLKCLPSIIVTDLFGDEDKRLIECFNDTEANKGNLIELLFHFQQAGTYDDIKCHPDYYWIAEIVASDLWSDEVNQRFWNKHWDGDVDKFKDHVHKCYSEFYPLTNQ